MRSTPKFDGSPTGKYCRQLKNTKPNIEGKVRAVDQRQHGAEEVKSCKKSLMCNVENEDRALIADMMQQRTTSRVTVQFPIARTAKANVFRIVKATSPSARKVRAISDNPTFRDLARFSPLSGVIERLFLSNSDQETQKMMKWQYGLSEYRPAKRSV